MFVRLLQLVAFASVCAQANPDLPAEGPGGLLVRFSAFQPAAQDAAHRALGTRLVFRSELQKIDVVALANPRKNIDPRELATACSAYLARAEVAECEPNRPLRLNTPPREPCPPDPVVPNPLHPVDGAAREIECSPFPGQDEGGPPVPPDSEQGRTPPNWRMGRLTPLWAQEAVGAPESRELLASLESERPLPEVPVGMLDGGFIPSAMPRSRMTPELRACAEGPDPASCGLDGTDRSAAIRGFAAARETNRKEIAGGPYHGASASNLVAGEPPVAVGRQSRIAMVSPAGFGNDGLITALDRYLAVPADRMPALVNMSMGVPDVGRASMREFARRTTVVVSAGNNFPDRLDRAVRESDAIIVGSVAPNGLASRFSQEGPEVTISAPSNLDIQTRGPDGQLTTFSGTSGAAPVVTGALSDVKALLPGVTTAELKLLLRNTAIPTAGTADGRNLNGAGSINQFKMLKVAAGLRAGWPGNRAALGNAGIYQLHDYAAREAAEAERLLAPGATCESRRQGLRALRRAFFANPGSAAIRARLARLYREEGFEDQASFYAPPTESVRTPKAIQLAKDRRFLSALSRGDLASARDELDGGASVTAAGGGEARDGNPMGIVSRSLEIPKQRKRELLRLLLDRGARLDPQGKIVAIHETHAVPPHPPGRVPVTMSTLAWSITEDFPDVTRDLLERGANPNQTDIGRSMLFVAVDGNRPAAAEALVARGADVNVANSDGHTPLVMAVATGNEELVRILLRGRPNLDYVIPGTTPPQTVLGLARSDNRPGIERLLREAGATR